MKIIDELNRLCEENSVKAGYPAGFSADFSPSLVEELGDLVSDIAIRYADTLRSPPENEHGPDRGEEDRGDSEKADVKRSGPEIEQIAPQQGATANAVLSFKTQHRHDLAPKV